MDDDSITLGLQLSLLRFDRGYSTFLKFKFKNIEKN
jgi:hypothetical protein